MRRAPRIEVEMEELEQILEHAQRGPLNKEEHEKLTAAIETLGWLTHELEGKRVSLKRLRALLFGAKTEKTEEIFPGEEPESEESEAEAEENGTRGKKPPKGHGRNGAESYSGAEKIKVEHETLRSGAQCPECEKGKVYRLKEPGRIVRVLGQAPLQAKLYELEKLRCNLCGTLFTAKAPEEARGAKYDATASSMIALLKYGSGLPFNRLDRLEGNLGIPLPAATQWDLVHQGANLAQPIFEEFIRQAAGGEVLHNDDTSMKILELMGKRWRKRQKKKSNKSKGSKKKDRSGIFTSGLVSVGEGRKIVLFFTGRKHAGENLKEVLRERAAALPLPIQMCDALSRNMSAEFAAIVANCLAHGRRQFVDVAENFPQKCEHVLKALGEVYRNDAKAKTEGLTAEERLRFHRQWSRPVMVELLLWFRQKLKDREVEPNSGLGQAIQYMKNHWWKLTAFYRYPGAPLDNNICERALKKAILHRKNSLFYRSENGARVGDLFMSLIYTAELAGESPFHYLCELQRHAAELRERPSEWMPWNYRERLGALEAAGTAKTE